MKKILFILFLSIGLIGGFSYYYLSDNDVEAKEEIVKQEDKKEVKEKVEKEKIIKIKVDVKGEVINPGVYELDGNSRVIDAINLAGGLTDKADTDMINLSKILVDQNVIIVYALEGKANTIVAYKEKIDICATDYNNACIKEEVVNKEPTKNSDSNLKDDASSSLNEKGNEKVSVININTANIEELTTLSGIGEAKANRIIEYRNNNGNFNTIEDIKNVAGIGDSIFEKVKNNITV